MREIKFRAWNVKGLYYEYITDLYWFEENAVHGFLDPKWVFEEWTGINGKDGREIDEGDIVRTQTGEEWEDDEWIPSYFIGDIGWIDATVGYRCGDLELWANDLIYDSEVVGNIHENPELLEGKD